MFADLNVPVPALSKQQLAQAASSSSKKGKGKQETNVPAPVLVFTPAQVAATESRIDMLVHLGYTVLALTQTVERKVDPKTFVNTVDPLLAQLRKRPGVLFLKRLTIVLDEESEKGFGLTTGHAALFAPYDLLALAPTTAASFSLACLTHTQPSPLTTHVLALPLALPRLPFALKHTLVRAALKNGAVFELAYAGALGADEGAGGLGSGGGGGEGGAGARRNWWAAAREVARVTKGKGILVSGGVGQEADLRAPRDVANLITVLGVSQDVAHDASTKVAQSLVLRAQTRKTFRAVFSEPKVVIPGDGTATEPAGGSGTAEHPPQSLAGSSTPAAASSAAREQDAAPPTAPPAPTPVPAPAAAPTPASAKGTSGKKRALEQGASGEPSRGDGSGAQATARKKTKTSKHRV